jgi:hypothetical protein
VAATFGRQTCPFCGALLDERSRWCKTCRLSIPTYREVVAPVVGSREFRRADVILSDSRIFQLLMYLIAFFFRLSVEAPAFAFVDAAVLVSMGAVITNLGGAVGGIVAIGIMLFLEYFVVDPAFQLGVERWNGVFELFLLYATVASAGALRLRERNRRLSDVPPR